LRVERFGVERVATSWEFCVTASNDELLYGSLR